MVQWLHKVLAGDGGILDQVPVPATRPPGNVWRDGEHSNPKREVGRRTLPEKEKRSLTWRIAAETLKEGWDTFYLTKTLGPSPQLKDTSPEFSLGETREELLTWVMRCPHCGCRHSASCPGCGAGGCWSCKNQRGGIFCWLCSHRAPITDTWADHRMAPRLHCLSIRLLQDPSPPY